MFLSFGEIRHIYPHVYSFSNKMRLWKLWSSMCKIEKIPFDIAIPISRKA